MKILFALVAAVTATSAAAQARSADAESKSPAKAYFMAGETRSVGSATVGGRRLPYHAVAGTLVVHSKGWEDTDTLETEASGHDKEKDDDKPKAEASMFYTAYFRDGVTAASRPITFLFNGGPGSSSLWLHMGAFGPVRVVTAEDRHTPAAPYAIANNDHSLVDASDLVFVDAPGTGFSRIAGKDKEKAFYGVDQDIDAFTQFITQFVSKYGRWNSAKFVFGESYGTMRAAGPLFRRQDGNAAFADTREPQGQYRISLLRVRPHGLRPADDTERAPRQCCGLHSADRKPPLDPGERRKRKFAA